MRTALVTIVHGRHTHLRRQRSWIAKLNPRPLLHVVVSMGDSQIRGILQETASVPTKLVEMGPMRELPLAEARNLGVDEAEKASAEAVVLLDVDCLPAERLVADYQNTLALLQGANRPAAVCGRVRYLPPGISNEDHTPESLERLGRDHPLRVVPQEDELVEGDARLLWSLNVGISVADWHRVRGFDERYVGYGGEDTDFGQRLRAAGGGMWWTSGAAAFHQWHPASEPPTKHLHSIVRNANLFRRTWGFEPMDGWLSAFEELGLIERAQEGWRTVQPSTHA